MSDREDLRIVKTRRSIVAAFLELLQVHSFEQITVRQLLEKALISKGTFYAHYLDKYDLAEKVVASTLQEFRSDIHERMASVRDGGSHEAISASLLHTLNTTVPRLNLLMKIRTDKINIERDMCSIITDEYLSFHKARGTKLENPDLRAHIITTFILGFLSWQKAHPFQITLDDYTKEIKSAISAYEELSRLLQP